MSLECISYVSGGLRSRYPLISGAEWQILRVQGVEKVESVENDPVQAHPLT